MRNFTSLIALFIVITSSTVFSQNDTELKEIESKLDSFQKTLSKIQQSVQANQSSQITIGKLILFKSDNIPTYNSKGKGKEKYLETGKNIAIDKILFDVRDGLIFDIQVLTSDNKIFTNKLATIEINRFSERCDMLQCFLGRDQTIYIQTCEFLKYERYLNQIAKNIRFELNKNQADQVLSKSKGINQIFNIKLYSDLLGTLGEEGNGLVQTEAEFITPINSSNLLNKNLYLFHYLRFVFGVSKFDSEFAMVPLDTDFSREKLLQRSWLNSEIGLNLITGLFRHKSNSRYSLDLIGGFSLANVSEDGEEKNTIDIPYVGIKPGFKISVTDNITMNLNCPIIWQTAPKLRNFQRGNTETVINPEFELNWNPSQNPGSKIYSRVKYFNFYGTNGAFWQFQLGYNLSISEIFNNKIGNTKI